MAVLRQRHALVETLLATGFPVAVPNTRKWLPIDEAIALNDKRMVRLQRESYHRNYASIAMQADRGLPTERIWICSPLPYGTILKFLLHSKAIPN